tara:strand:- start:516 stop:824 length:309 start_codon:yes stop_codon:yes gene_type:complete
MSIKLVLLKSGEQVVSDTKELVSDDKVHGYLFDRPQKISTAKPVLLTEETIEDRNIQITLSPWILLSKDTEMMVPKEWVVTIVEPLESIVKMYQDKINGKDS